MITILDYGINNISSLEKAVRKLGHEVQVSTNLDGATKLLIPGVGAYGAAMQQLAPLKSDIRSFAADGNPVMGICLGQQLLFERSEELGEFEGLGIVPGTVKYLPPSPGLKVPHMGWSALNYVRHDGLGEGGRQGEQVYFVHSLYVECTNPEDVVATAEHGIQFTAAIQHKNVWGTQFHPEKSSAVGLRILERFLQC